MLLKNFNQPLSYTLPSKGQRHFHGIGKQIRGYINILDTTRCIEIAIRNPSSLGEFRVFNQFTQQFDLISLTKAIADVLYKEFGFSSSVEYIDNPRVEEETHFYNARNNKLLDFGFERNLLNYNVISNTLKYIQKYKDNIDLSTFFPKIKWDPKSKMKSTLKLESNLCN